MTIVVDTSAFSVYGRGKDKRLAQWFSADFKLIVPIIVVGELRAGFSVGNQQQGNEALLQKFLDSPNVEVVTINDNTTKRYAEVYLYLRRKGKPIGTNDIWIAAITLEQDASLLTLDNDFSYVKDLPIVNL